MSTEISTMTRPTALAESNQGATEFAGLVSMGDQLRRTGFLPAHIKDGVSFAAIVLMGRELGMGTMAACRKLQVIKGTVTERADSQLARFKSAGGRAEFKELSETRAVLILRHPNGDQHTETFTIEDAKRAGLASNDNYNKHPKAMLRSRAITAGLKSIGWEGAVGIYDPDEVSEPEPAREPVVVRHKFPQTESRPAAVDCGRSPATAVNPREDTAQPPATPANEERMQQSRLAVNRAKTTAELERFRSTTEERLKTGAYTPAQADELFNLIDNKLDWLTSEDNGQEFAHEAAEHEVQS